jgi:hypothetical protein
MKACPPKSRDRRWKAGVGRELSVVLMALLTLVGCQGISSTGNQQTPSGSLSLSGSTVDFGSVTVGTSKTLTATATNNGTATVTVTGAVSSASQFSLTKPALPLTLAVGQNVTLSMTFTPSAPGNATGNLSISSNAADGSATVSLSGDGVMGTPGTLTPTQSSLGFASVQVGLTQTLAETVTNSGGSSVTISQAGVTGIGFSVNGLTPPLTLMPGQSVSFSGIFTPQSTGSVSGSLNITSDASNPTLAVALSGTGTPDGQLAVAPPTWDFNNVVVGLSANHPVTLSASGASVTVTAANMSSSEFAVSGLPVTIAAGSSVPVTVTFTPQATGAASGTASFASNASNSPAVLSMDGNGTPAPVHRVQLSWNASVSSNINGYNIYRGPSSNGPFSQINSSLIASTSYTDNFVVDGQTYYYRATAVDSNNQESAKSAPSQQAVIPAP